MTSLTLDIQKFINYFCISQLLIFLLFLLTGTSSLTFLIVAFTPINLAFLFLLHRKKLNVKAITSVLSILLVLIITTSLSPYQSFFKYGMLALCLSAFSISLIFRGEHAFKLLTYLNFTLNIIVLYLAFKSGFNIKDFGNNIFYAASRNLVSAYLIFGIVYYLSFCYELKAKINLFLITIFVINCLVLYGRSGVALSLVLMIYSIYKKLGKGFFLGLIAACLIFIQILIDIFLKSTKFAKSGFDTPRTELFKEYLTDLSIQDILFGRNISECCSLISSYGHNPHNSFIFAHTAYGIGHLILILIGTSLVVKSKSIDLVILMLVLYIRYSLDTIGFFNIYDVPLLSIYLIAYRKLNT